MISAVTYSPTREARTIGNVAPHLREIVYNAEENGEEQLKVL
jgi:hypothetical protein